MNNKFSGSTFVLGLFVFLGLTSLGYLLGAAAIDVKEYERSVTVKGLSEREVPADIVIWPIVFVEASNELAALYAALEFGSQKIRQFLLARGIKEAEITLSPPAITDKSAQQYGGSGKAEFRYSAIQTVTVYSTGVAVVRDAMKDLLELGKQGIVFSAGGYDTRTEYKYSGLNGIKPAMIEEATTNARGVAQKFAEDSNSSLGKIKRASQGQFSISPRDKNNPHIKKVRVVSTIEYYLSD